MRKHKRAVITEKKFHQSVVSKNEVLHKVKFQLYFHSAYNFLHPYTSQQT